MASKGKIDDVDRHVGRMVAARRIALGMMQHELAAAIGVSYQQVHKYERGQNRMSCARIALAARALGVRPADLFPPLDGTWQFEAPELLEVVMGLAPKHQQAVRRLVLSNVNSAGLTNSL